MTGHSFRMRQANCSVSSTGVLRGLHFAEVPPGQAKYVTCTSGAVFDVVVDIRVGSPTYGRWDGLLLDAADRRSVYLAEGLAHGFLALQDSSTVMYLCSEPYSPTREHTIAATDPEIGIDWPLPAEQLLLSDRDRRFRHWPRCERPVSCRNGRRHRPSSPACGLGETPLAQAEPPLLGYPSNPLSPRKHPHDHNGHDRKYPALHRRPAFTARGTRTADVFNPSTGAVQAQVLLASAADVDTAVASAVEAQKVWAAYNPQKRARVLMKFIELVNSNADEIAELLSLEHGKTVADSLGDIQRGVEVIEFATGIPHLMFR